MHRKLLCLETITVLMMSADETPEHIADMCHGDDGASGESAPTILDYLNEDCWRLALDHLPVNDLVRSERVSRRWQRLVHSYLQEAGVGIDWFSNEIMYNVDGVKMNPKNRIFKIKFRRGTETVYQQLMQLLDKWGPYVVFSYCSTQKAFEIITKCCANLKVLLINMHRFGRFHLSQDQVEFTETLERIVLMYFTNKETKIHPSLCRVKFDQSEVSNVRIGLDFWPNIKPTKLKSLMVRGSFDFRYFLSTVKCYPDLTELYLEGEHDNIHCLLEKMPKLEHLCLNNLTLKAEDDNGLGAEYRSKCSGLSSLKYITSFSSPVKSWWLEAVTSGCRELRSLDFRMTGAGNLVTLCRAHAQTLTEVRQFADYLVKSEDAAAMIAACPNLTTLDLRYCNNIREDLLPAAARAARHHKNPVLLRIGYTPAGAYCDRDLIQSLYPWLIVDTEKEKDIFITMSPRQTFWQNIYPI